MLAELAQETLRIIKKYRSLGIIGIDISDDALLGAYFCQELQYSA